jgi:spore photoproduct lyase
MFDRIYVEEEVREHPRTRRILARYPGSTVVECERFGEVFNRRRQNFRLQKRRPALILAAKHGRLVLEAPAGYGIGAPRNYYFSHLLNCIYDCRYCFLQGMYRSAHLVLFVNFEDFQDAIRGASAIAETQATFFSGYDCDSLALEPVTDFAASFLPFFESLPSWVSLELRTKSIQTRCLLARPPSARVVVAFSLLPDAAGAAVEAGVPRFCQRLRAIRELAEHGWPIGLRFDPLLLTPDFEAVYAAFFEDVFAAVPRGSIHSASLGPFRLPDAFHERMTAIYPEEPLLVRGLESRRGLVTYRDEIARPLLDFAKSQILARVPEERFFPCLDPAPAARAEAS